MCQVMHIHAQIPSLSARRAWIEIKSRVNNACRYRSLSARRAWIEILCLLLMFWPFPVALRKESVDRNGLGICYQRDDVPSLSARRAWIEIVRGCFFCVKLLVALRKESVDRNLWWGVRKAVGSLVALRKESVDRNNIGSASFRACTSRSPQGERG